MAENGGMQRGGVDEARVETVVRRLRTIPSRVVAFLLVMVLLPVLLVVAAMVDVFRRVVFGVRATAVRLVAFLWVYLAAEVVGVVALAALWVVAWTPVVLSRQAAMFDRFSGCCQVAATSRGVL
jgi:hypothetical protein